MRKKLEGTVENSTGNEQSELEILQNQVKLLTKQLESLLATKEVEPEKDIDRFEDTENTDNKIPLDDYIKVMSLVDHPLVLSTLPKGRGKPFVFEKYGQVKRILYKDLVDIMENHSNFLEAGYFVILNPKVIRRHGLDDAYTKIITKDKIDSILHGNQSDAVNMFKTANPKQQELIIEMIIKDMVSGNFVDLNFVDRLSRIVGYSVQEKAEDAKKLKLILENKEVS